MKWIFHAIILLCSVQLIGQTTIKACFLGNSYTYYNDLPVLVENLATADGNTFIHDQSAPPGYWLEYHCTNATSLAMLAADNWDYVVLQEQSQKPSFPWLQFLDETLPYSKILTDSIRSANPCAVPVYFDTWGRKLGEPMWDSINTFEKMNDRLHNAYDYMADQHTGRLAPVGIGFGHIYSDASPVVSHNDLYNADNSHPSIFGSYLAACVFYEVFFETSCIGNTYFPIDLSAAQATYLQNVANHVVNSVDSVTINYVFPEAGFEANFDGLEATFTNTSIHAFDFQWDFGDMSTSTETDPVHFYPSYDSYTVQLTAAYCPGGLTDVATSPYALELSNHDELSSIITTNGNQLILNSNYSLGTVRIYSPLGQLCTETEIDSDFAAIELKAGTYIVQLKDVVKRIVIID